MRGEYKTTLIESPVSDTHGLSGFSHTGVTGTKYSLTMSMGIRWTLSFWWTEGTSGSYCITNRQSLSRDRLAFVLSSCWLLKGEPTGALDMMMRQFLFCISSRTPRSVSNAVTWSSSVSLQRQLEEITVNCRELWCCRENKILFLN